VPELNIPAVHQEVTDCFQAYDRALLSNDVDALESWFHRGPESVRFGIAEELHGHQAIAAFRRKGPGVVRLPFRRVDVVTIGTETAVVTAEFDEPNGAIGRQSQTWIRTGAGWRVIAGHVSIRSTHPNSTHPPLGAQ
jgi:hypothetical protein